MPDYYMLDFDFDYHNKIVALDMDNTIIATKSGKKFPKDKNDWKFIFDSNDFLIKENKKKKSIIIITNQLGINKGKTDYDDIKHKITSIQKKLDIPMLAIICNANNIYRKPRIGTFELILDIYKKKNKDFTKFTFVGDAAGRKKDFSDSDYKYLINVKTYLSKSNIKIKADFKLPEQYFLKKSSDIKYDDNINIKGYQLDYKGKNSFKSIIGMIESQKKNNKNHIYLVSGYPSSGKTTLSKKLKEHYKIEHISKDIYKTKFKKMVMNNIKQEKDIIIEGLYYSLKQRDELKGLVNNNYHIINIIIDIDIDTALHFNQYRHIMTGADVIPNIVYYSYRKYYTDNPEYSIIRVNPKIDNKISININDYYLI